MNRPTETKVTSYLDWVLPNGNELSPERMAEYENIVLVIDKIPEDNSHKTHHLRFREFPKEGFALPEDCSENLVFV